jgi:hypothetical protein
LKFSFCDEWKIQLINNRFNNIQREWLNSCANVNNSKYAKKFINLIKYKCEALIVMCVSIYTNKCNMQCLNNGFNKFKVDDLIQVNMFIIQKMWKFSFNHSSIIVKYWVTWVLGYYNNCNMQFVSNCFNIKKWIIQLMYKCW